MGTPLSKQENQLPILKKLVLREVEVKTPSKIPLGPAYEHPVKEKLDFENPINTIYTCDDGKVYFGSKGGELTKINANGNFIAIKTEPADCEIAKIKLNHNNYAIHGFMFFK